MTSKEIRKKNLEKLIAKHGNQRKLADKIGTVPAYISQMMTDVRKMGDDLARRIEEKLRLPKGWMDQDHSATITGATSYARDRKIPLLRSDEISGWEGESIAEEEGMGHVDAPDSASSRAFAVMVKGKGMEPEFQEGELVIVDPEKPINHNDFVLVLLKGRSIPLIRRFIVSDDRKFLESLNPMYGEPPIHLTSPPVFIGKIIERRKVYSEKED